MRDLVAQVSSGLLRFPEVTVDALGEDEVTLDSVLYGKFALGRSALSWMVCGPQLEVVHSGTGERFSAYRFSGVTESPPSILTVRGFTWLKRSGLLVGLQEQEGSILCLYDLGISRVVKAVVMPGRITAIEPLVSYGGASASTQHLHQSLRWFFGIAAVVTDVGHVLLVDLCLDDLSCTQSELEASDLEVVNKSPSEIPRLREGVTQQGRHLCLQLCSPTGSAVTALQYIHRTNQLAVGFYDGVLQLWNMKTLKKEYHSQLEGGRVPVYAFTFQEPENDPRNCCYLWAVQSAQDLEGDVVSLHLLQLAFAERKCLTSGKILYEGLEYCDERYSQDLNGTAFPLRAQATNTRLLSCQTIEKFRHHPDRDDSMSEAASPDTSVSIFTWQVKSYGQGQPSTFIGVFDINRWYHAQMPDSLRAGESLRNCPYMAVWSLDSVLEKSAPCKLLDVMVHERSLSRGLPYTCPPPEQFFNPTTYNFDASCLLNTGILHFTCAGYQKETLSFLKKAVPTLSDGISNGFSRCLVSGLLSPRLADVQPSSLSQEEQLDAILTTAVETSSLGLITGCIRQWTAEEQPGSAEKLRYILEWAWDKVVHTKEELDKICAPLFDSSSNFTDPQLLQLLQHCQRLLSNLSTIFHCLLSEAQELTQRGLTGLMNKSMVSSLISQYSQVVLWFCRTGLLPETSDDDVLQISRPFYGFSLIKNYYTGQREELQRLVKEKWSADCLMIDGLVSQCGERLSELWRRDEGGTGQYPPPSLHALLDLYLLENIEEPVKHAIVIYLLLDVMYSFPNKSDTSVESFPTAFAIPIGLVKLVQGLWLLDHHDHENSLELLLHPSCSGCVWEWQHGRVLQALMCRGKHSSALRYLHVMKPSLSSTPQAKLCLSVLLHNRCIVEAWAMLRQHANKLNLEELLRFLYETCQELNLMKELLKLPLAPSEQECLERFLQSTGGYQNRELLMVHYLQQSNYVPALQINQTLKMNLAADRDPKLKERSNTRNSILNQYGKVLPRAQRKLAIERSKPYQHPATVLREVSRPQPLSTVAKRSAETVLTRAAFIKNVLTKFEEVWVGKDATPQPSPQKSARELEVPVASPNPPTLHVPEAFVGTPINMLTKRVSRLFDLVVQPSPKTSTEVPRTQGTPPRSITSWAPPKSITKAPELSLLQTPQVVRRARALAASAPVFSSFTPQSILRSSLRPTPVGTPSASPGRSVTPPLRLKESRNTITPPLRPRESRITFLEGANSPDLPGSSVRWSNGSAERQLKKPTLPPEGGVETWSEQSGEEEDYDEKRISSETKGKAEQKVESESGSPIKELQKLGSSQILPTLSRRASLGHETSEISIQSDTTAEFRDALSPGDLERQRVWMETSVDEEVVVRVPGPTKLFTPSPDGGATEEAPAEKHEANADQEEKSPDPAEAHTQLDSNEINEGPISGTPVDEEDHHHHHPENVEEPNEHREEPELTKEAELEPQKPVSQVTFVVEETIEEPLEMATTKGLEPVTEGSSIDTEPIRSLETPEVMTTNDSKTGTQEPITEDSNVDNEAISRTALEPEECVNHEGGEGALQGEAVEVQNKAEALEISDLDEYVERHLFGDDLSPSQTFKVSSQTWMSSDGDVNEEAESEAVDAVETPAAETQKSVTSSEAATSESHSVVSLNDSDEASSAESEEESGAEEHEEDSGSEVEIIEEVKGNGRLLPPPPDLYLEELPPHDPFLQEQDAAVLSLVSPDSQLKVMDGVMEEDVGKSQMVMVGLEAADGPVSFTELKPSTTLIIPLELATEPQDLLDGEEPQEPHPVDSCTFSLVLEAGEEEGLIASEVDTNSHSVPQDIEPIEDVENQPLLEPDNSESVCFDYAEAEEVEGLPTKVMGSILDTPLHPSKLSWANVESENAEVEPELIQEPEPVYTEEKPALKAQENGDFEDLASAEVEINEPALEQEESAPESSVPHKKLVVEVNKLSTANLELISVAVPDTDKLSYSLETSKSTEEHHLHPELPSKHEEANDKPNEEETVKREQRSPARSSRKTVTFPITDTEKDLSEETQEPKVPSTPRRVTRSGKQVSDVEVPLTPRRSARKTEFKLNESTPSTKTARPATPKRGTRRTRNTNVGSDEEAQPLEESVLTVGQSARKSRKTSVDVPEVPEVPEVLEEKEQFKSSASPSRVTRKSSRGLSLALESFQNSSAQDTEAQSQSALTPPRSRRKTRAGTAEKVSNSTFEVDEAQLQNVSRRLTRSQLWIHEEEPEKEKHLVLDAPLDVDSAKPLATALMERLADEGTKGDAGGAVVTEVIRAKRRTARSVQPPAAEGSSEAVSAEAEEPVMKTSASVRRTRASKAPEPDPLPVNDTSTLQRTRGKKKDSAPMDLNVSEMTLSPPVTRTRRAASAAVERPEEIPSNDVQEPAQEAKPRPKRTARSKAAPVAPVEVDFISPPASPESSARTQTRSQEEHPTLPKMNLRRKRVMEAIFPKPVTRRKKL
ncbi:protein ELYS [Hoplias malabaricus]|uniref:protein ELYS n=1 Tax=Hoplias malabaricus TaxID=27720 RepID=UPI003462429D